MGPQFPLSRRHQRSASHIQSCRECASAMRREQQYLERLREAPIPPASNDLTARLLARTQELAALPPAPSPQHQASRTAVRVLAMAAGGTVAAAGMLAAGAFALAGDPVRAGGSADTAALSQISAQTPADGRTLSVDRLSALRSEGWVCPELKAMGFHLESARAVVLEGRPAIELKLSNGTHYAIITERYDRGDTEAEPDAGRANPPLQVLASSPWTATYRTQGRTFTYVSDLPAEQADDAVPILQRLSRQAGEGVAASAEGNPQIQSSEPVVHRLQRGVNKIAALFAR